MSSRVSVVIVTRDRADVLARCLDSILRQTPQPDEIIVVAGSDGSFPEDLRLRYAAQHLILACCSEPNISKARNIGVEHAGGDMVIFIDDDAIAHDRWVAAYTGAFENDPGAWAAGGSVLDARTDPPTPEFAHGLIHPSGRQVETRDPSQHAPRHGYRPSVKGCNFALRLDRIPGTMRFDPFFAFAFDEADLIMAIHEEGGGVISVPGAVVDHLHAPGAYRSDGPLDRDWYREFASHTRFMRKHSNGFGACMGWFVVFRRLGVHAARVLAAVVQRKITITTANACIADAISGVRRGSSSHGTA